MQYPELQYLPEAEDPSLTLESERLIVKVIDNTGLLAPPVPPSEKAYFNSTFRFTPFTHHLGYHGIRTLYDKRERRNAVAPFIAWANLQGFRIEGIDNDAVDERAASGTPRGWPMQLHEEDGAAVLTMPPLPNTQCRYSLAVRVAEPDAVDLSFRFVFGRAAASGQRKFSATWASYVAGWDDVRMHYPRGTADHWHWHSVGEKPPMIIGEPVGYDHRQAGMELIEPAMPLAYGRIGNRFAAFMFDDPRVGLFGVNAGGHSFISPVQNPAWDWWWGVDEYPLDEPIGYNGRIVYAEFTSEADIYQRYADWLADGPKTRS